MPKAKEFIAQTLESVAILGHIIPTVPVALEFARQVMHNDPNPPLMIAITAIEIIRMGAISEIYAHHLLERGQTFDAIIISSLILGFWFHSRHKNSAAKC